VLRSILGGAALLLCSSTALAGDVWTDPFPGIRYLHRSTDDPKEIHALVIDLSRPEISLRATRDNEKGRTTTSFASLVGAAAAVNGDFYNTNGSYDPVGLAIGEGIVWSDDTAGHRFIACTAAKVCEIDATNQARAPDASWTAAVGGNVLLVNGGAIVQTPDADAACGDFCTVQHPRTAAGLSADRTTLILVVVEGRQTPILGMTLNRLAELMLELGSDVALNLDGGGSSAMVVGGTRVSGRPTNEPSERSVSNHLGVIFDPAAATTGRLVGFIRENDIFDENAGLAGASVALSTGESTTTDARGFYEFPEVAPGMVTVSVELAGFLPASETKEVAVGITNWKSIALMRGVPDAGVMMEAPDAGESADGGAAPQPEDAGSTVDAAVESNDDGTDPTTVDDGGCTCVRRDRDLGGLALLACAGVCFAIRGRARRRRI
jgi:hypothetical protein